MNEHVCIAESTNFQEKEIRNMLIEHSKIELLLNLKAWVFLRFMAFNIGYTHIGQQGVQTVLQLNIHCNAVIVAVCSNYCLHSASGI